jgi:hypothetical protein
MSIPTSQDLADHFNERYPGLGWDESIVSQIILSSYDSTLDTVEEHLECFADHQVLVNSQLNLATTANV